MEKRHKFFIALIIIIILIIIGIFLYLKSKEEKLYNYEITYLSDLEGNVAYDIYSFNGTDKIYLDERINLDCIDCEPKMKERLGYSISKTKQKELEKILNNLNYEDLNDTNKIQNYRNGFRVILDQKKLAHILFDNPNYEDLYRILQN